MSDLNIGELIKLISGSEPSPEQVQRIEAIAHRAGIERTDAMLPILAALDIYHGAFSRLPGNVATRCKSVAEQAAATASTMAQANMNNAVARLVPAFEKQFRESIDAAVKRIQLGSSLLSIFAGLIMLAMFFVAGMLFGSRILAELQDGTLTQAQVWHELGWATGLGIASSLLLIYVGIDWLHSGSGRPNRTQTLLALLGTSGFVTLICHQLAIFHF